MATCLHFAQAATAALHQELVDTREALRSGAHLDGAPREQRQRRALASRVFLLSLQSHWNRCSGSSVSGSSPLPWPPRGGS
ncbi:hypothetical protein J2W49_003925 [Hydrogenophaga palleronii]|uniref:Uncharacterized protein n=1 Tax=Hydrogenophaga palleronii TaxID=65655 RepID=A0ABU1WRY9_9BURK|nr:hypothetical protein [Hydrogenophaga palleronii]MDR7151949.1 hypothetical protein [Hydrogenophaga palleronii]